MFMFTIPSYKDTYPSLKQASPPPFLLLREGAIEEGGPLYYP
jgi:hypothetical protein